MSLTPPAPSQDELLDQVFQHIISGITAIDGTLVRPRWQPVPPQQPEVKVNWCAFGVTSATPDDGPYIEHDPMLDGSDNYQRHEELEFLLSFYGLQGQQNAALLRDGLAIPQNMEPLEAIQVGFVECGAIRNVPSLLNQTWRRRWDMTVTFRRRTDRTYAVKNILAADIHLFDDSGHVDELIQTDSLDS